MKATVIRRRTEKSRAVFYANGVCVGGVCVGGRPMFPDEGYHLTLLLAGIDFDANTGEPRKWTTRVEPGRKSTLVFKTVRAAVERGLSILNAQ